MKTRKKNVLPDKTRKKKASALKENAENDCSEENTLNSSSKSTDSVIATRSSQRLGSKKSPLNDVSNYVNNSMGNERSTASLTTTFKNGGKLQTNNSVSKLVKKKKPSLLLNNLQSLDKNESISSSPVIRTRRHNVFAGNKLSVGSISSSRNNSLKNSDASCISNALEDGFGTNDNAIGQILLCDSDVCQKSEGSSLSNPNNYVQKGIPNLKSTKTVKLILDNNEKSCNILSETSATKSVEENVSKNESSIQEKCTGRLLRKRNVKSATPPSVNKPKGKPNISQKSALKSVIPSNGRLRSQRGKAFSTKNVSKDDDVSACVESNAYSDNNDISISNQSSTDSKSSGKTNLKSKKSKTNSPKNTLPTSSVVSSKVLKSNKSNTKVGPKRIKNDKMTGNTSSEKQSSDNNKKPQHLNSSQENGQDVKCVPPAVEVPSHSSQPNSRLSKREALAIALKQGKLSALETPKGANETLKIPVIIPKSSKLIDPKSSNCDKKLPVWSKVEQIKLPVVRKTRKSIGSAYDLSFESESPVDTKKKTKRKGRPRAATRKKPATKGNTFTLMTTAPDFNQKFPSVFAAKSFYGKCVKKKSGFQNSNLETCHEDAANDAEDFNDDHEEFYNPPETETHVSASDGPVAASSSVNPIVDNNTFHPDSMRQSIGGNTLESTWNVTANTDKTTPEGIRQMAKRFIGTSTPFAAQIGTSTPIVPLLPPFEIKSQKPIVLPEPPKTVSEDIENCFGFEDSEHENNLDELEVSINIPYCQRNYQKNGSRTPTDSLYFVAPSIPFKSQNKTKAQKNDSKAYKHQKVSKPVQSMKSEESVDRENAGDLITSEMSLFIDEEDLLPLPPVQGIESPKKKNIKRSSQSSPEKSFCEVSLYFLTLN